MTNVPLRPLLASRVSAVPPVWSAYAELNRTPVEEPLVVLVDDGPVDPPVALDEDAAGALEEAEPDEFDEVGEVDELAEVEVLDEGAVGWKLSLFVPKPTSEAKVPPTVTESVSF